MLGRIPFKGNLVLKYTRVIDVFIVSRGLSIEVERSPLNSPNMNNKVVRWQWSFASYPQSECRKHLMLMDESIGAKNAPFLKISSTFGWWYPIPRVCTTMVSSILVIYIDVLLTWQLIFTASGNRTLGSYPSILLALAILTYSVCVASLMLPRVKGPSLPFNQSTHSDAQPIQCAIPAGILTSNFGTCPKAAHTARQKARKVTGSPFEMKNASPAAVPVVRRFSRARTCASATLETYTKSHRLFASPIIQGVSFLAIHW